MSATRLAFKAALPLLIALALLNLLRYKCVSHKYGVNKGVHECL